jgi:STAS domain-containing protein
MKLESRTYADAAGLEPHLDRAAASRQRIVLDLSGLEYVSSAGLRCFMLAAKQARAKGSRILLAALRRFLEDFCPTRRPTTVKMRKIGGLGGLLTRKLASSREYAYLYGRNRIRLALPLR